MFVLIIKMLKVVFILTKYTFGVWLDIDAEDEEQAVALFDSVVKNNFVTDSYCFEWKEID